MERSLCRVGRAEEQGQSPKECKHLTRGERGGGENEIPSGSGEGVCRWV